MKSFAAAARILVASMMVVLVSATEAQQAYPSKPIRFITPYAPGGTTSVIARLLGQKLTESWGQQVLVENRGGGNTLIGTDALAKSPPDGYTIILVGSAHVLVPLLLKAPFDPIKDFAPVATVGSSEFVLVLHPSVPANSLQEFIALARSRPEQLNHASAGSGTLSHLAIEMFNMLVGVRLQNIPYKGPALHLLTSSADRCN